MFHRLLDALFGERHKLARDFAGASLLIAVAALGAAHVLARGVEGAALAARGAGATLARSVLDDPITTGSLGQRPVLDPCAAPKGR